MRALLVPAAFAAAIALAPSAFAAGTAAKPMMAAKPAATTSMQAAAVQTTTGSVTIYNMKAHTLKLDNGKLYHLPVSFKDPGLKAGDKVSVSWEMKNGKHAASDVTIVK